MILRLTRYGGVNGNFVVGKIYHKFETNNHVIVYSLQNDDMEVKKELFDPSFFSDSENSIMRIISQQILILKIWTACDNNDAS